MRSDLLALVSNGGVLTGELQDAVEQQLDCELEVLSHDETRRQLWARARGLLLLVVEEAGDVELVLRLVQEIALKELAVEVVIVERKAVPGAAALNSLNELLLRRLTWPQNSAAFVDVVRSCLQRSGGAEGAENSIRERVAHALLDCTPSLRDLVEPLSLAAAHDVPVLISGETGTGKTYVAKLLHECSPRHQERFLVVSCGTLAPTLIESELFGHVKGAFTGADQHKEGKFAAAGRGTLLLDEIDSLGLEQQSNLLRVMETGEFEPVGSNQTRLCQARIIAASNWNLEAAVESGKFRRDLYYRMHVMTFHLPPLRERRLDIGPLVRSMVARYNTKFRKELLTIHPETLAALEWFSWPGNIRQLENVVQQAVLVSSGPALLPSFLPQTVQRPTANGAVRETVPVNSLAYNRQDVERTLIQRALVSAANSRTVAARSLGISRVTLYKKMRKYGLFDQAETAPA